MTRDEAKQILLLHRPDAPGEPDPRLNEALRIAANDLDLKRWVEQQRQFDSTLRAELRAIEPPADLAKKIIAERPIPRVSFWRREPVLAIAACLVILLSLAAFWRPPRYEETFADFSANMTSFALRTYQMDIVTNNEAAVRQHLATQGAPADFPLTPALEKLPVKGGGRLTWEHRPVAMMCFSLTNAQTAFMFVIDQKEVRAAPQNTITGSRSTLNTVSWVQDGKVYLIAASETPETLRQLAP